MLLSDYITSALNEIQDGAKAAKWNAQILNNAGPGCPMGITFDVPIIPDSSSSDSKGSLLRVPESDELTLTDWKLEPPVIRFTLLVSDPPPSS